VNELRNGKPETNLPFRSLSGRKYRWCKKRRRRRVEDIRGVSFSFLIVSPQGQDALPGRKMFGGAFAHLLGCGANV
jgi:hypothetical protein